MDEVDLAAGRAGLGHVVEQAHALAPQVLADLLDVVDAVGHLLDAGAAPVEELADRESGDSGASSCTYEPESPTSSIASRTPCSSLTSVCTQRIPYALS